MGDPLRSVLKGELLPAYHIGCILSAFGNIQFVYGDKAEWRASSCNAGRPSDK